MQYCCAGSFGRLVVVWAIAQASWAQAQEPEGARCDARLDGHITDEVFDLAVPGVRVLLVDPSGTEVARTRSDADGGFVFDGLCAGPYTLRALDDAHDALSRDIVVPTRHVHLELHGRVEAVVVEAARWGTEDTRTTTVIDGEALARTRGDDLAQVAATAPGVVVQRGSGDVSKPILRGMSERRMLVLFDGVRHEGQKWGPDHGTEIDPFAAGSITVVRGAAGVRYGPDAIAGVLRVDPRPLRTAPGVDGEVHGLFAANGLRSTAAARIDGAPAGVPGFAWRLEGNIARGASLRAPDYVLGNTASGTYNVGASLGWRGRGVEIVASWRHHRVEAGVFYGNRAESPSVLADLLGAPVPPGSERWRVRWPIDVPRQAVDHDTGILRATASLAPGTLRAAYSIQLDRRREFEPIRGDDDRAQYDFTLRTHGLDASFDHRPAHIGRANLGGTVGVMGQFQENVYRGLPLVPNERSGTFGAFAAERVWGRAGEIEVGARYDHQTRLSVLTPGAYGRHAARDTLGPDDCALSDTAARCLLAWNTGSASVGGLVRAVPDLLDLKLDLSGASRFPDLDELYLNGTAPTLPVYGVGDPSLGVETTWSASFTMAWTHRWTTGQVGAFGSLVDDYIEFAPDLDPAGSVGVEVLSRGAFPRYRYRAVDAWFAGVDGVVEIAPQEVIGLSVRGALVRAGERDDPQGFLAGVPPDHLGAAAIARLPTRGRVGAASLRVEGDVVGRQGRWDASTDLAPPPRPYALLGAGVGLSLDLGHNVLDLDLQGRNLTNQAYRRYTSLNRTFADEPGWDVRLRATLRFDVHPPHKEHP